ncbi:MAG: phospholipid carrier-dependent glycosyltransferase [Desulforhopalus sp.]
MTKNQLTTVVLLFFTVVYLLPLGVRPLLIPDEPRYAEIPREMIVSGDWVLPHFNGLKYYEKPVMGYWVHALSQVALGESNFSVRLPSAISTGLVAFLILYILKSALGRQDKRVYLAPLIFLSSFGVMGIGTITVLDNLLNFFLTAGVGLFFLASEKKHNSRAERFLLILAGGFVGCAFMTKGFLAFVVPVITVIPYLFWKRRASDIIRMLWLPAAVALVISLPWGILAHLKDSDFWNYFFWHEHINRFFSGGTQHKEPFWYFIVVIIPLFFPWIVMLPTAISGLVKNNNSKEESSNLISFCICWFVFPFLFFSFSSGKLATYILPCLPPLVILTTLGLYTSSKSTQRFLKSELSLLLFLLFAGISTFIGSQLIGLNLVPLPDSLSVLSAETLQYSRAVWKPVIITLSLMFMAVFIFSALKSKDETRKIVYTALSPLLLMVSAPFAIPDLSLMMKAPGIILEEEAPKIPEDAMVIADSGVFGATCWYLKRNDVFFIQRAGEVTYGMKRDGNEDRVLSYRAIQQLIADPHEEMIVLILKEKRWNQYFSNSPEPKAFTSAGKDGFVVVKY